MAERFVSPGVYTQERDFSFYVSRIGEPALGLIGETKKGPAFQPTLIQNMGEFGGFDTNMYVPYAANGWFKNANQAYVVRVLGLDNMYDEGSDNVVYITATGGTSQEYIVAALLVSGSPSAIVVSGGSIANETSITLTDFLNDNPTTFKLNAQGSPISINKVFPAISGELGQQAVKLLDLSNGKEFQEGTFFFYSAHSETITANNHPFAMNGYSHARTPVIVSNVDNASTPVNLFTVYTKTAGYAANQEIKIAFENIDPDKGEFDLVVREFDDIDSRQIVLERFTKLSLSSSASTYIARVIGDSADGSGEYDSSSNYIYVVMEPGDKSGLVPAGYGPINAPGSATYLPPNWPVKTSYDQNEAIARQYLGVDFSSLSKDHVMYNEWSQWNLDENTGTVALSGYNIDSATTGAYFTSTSGLSDYTKAERKFVVPVLGGRDGWSRKEGPRNLLSSAPTAKQQTAFETAIDTLSNPEEFNINVLALPGVNIGSSIGTYAITMCEDRADCFYVGDAPAGYTSASQIVSDPGLSALDTNYAATYWPYVRFYDSDNDANITIPPTPQVLEAIAYTDQVAYPWWAAAGLNRGLLSNVSRAEVKLTQADRDELYENRINPIATFPGQGIAIWGQKTLQTRSTALDRINVRRMLLYVRKVIAGASKFVVFEPNDEATRDRLQAIIQPTLDLIRIKRGLEDFRIILDESVNTPEVIDRGQIVAQIFIKPTKAAETIVLQFNITAQGVEFEE